jgi:ATP-binding cassette subfamily B protein
MLFQSGPYGFSVFAILEYFHHLKTGNDLRTTFLALLSVGNIVSILIFYIFTRLARTSSFELSMDISTQVQVSLAHHMKNLPMGFFSSRDPGDLSVLMIRDPEALMRLLTHILPQFIAGLIFPVVGIILLLFVDWRLSLCILIVILVALPFVIGTQFLVRWIGKRHHMAIMEANSRMLEYLEGIKPIKAFNLGGEHFHKFREAAHNLKKMSIQLEAGSGPSVCIGGSILHGVLPAVVLTSVHLFELGTLTPENFIIFATVGLAFVIHCFCFLCMCRT